MSVTPVVASGNCLTNCFNGIQHKVYAAHEKICGLCSTDTKVYGLLIAGRLLQAVALVGIAASIAYTLFSIPIALVGLVSAVAVGVLGTYLAGSPDEINEMISMVRPFVAGQPVGLRNGRNQCWLNSSLQLLAHIPAYQARMRQIPEFAQFLDSYTASRANFEKVSSTFDANTIRQYLSAQLGAAQVDPGPIQHDAAQVFEFLFEGPNALYNLEQQIDGVASPNQIESMIRINLVVPEPRPSIQQLFEARFDYQNDQGRRIQQFFPNPPNDLLIQAGRFIQRNDPVTGAFVGFGKINDALDVPERLEVPNQFVRTNEASNYLCDAFLVHNGTTPNSGHYVCYVKIGDVWWGTSDRIVREVSADHARDAMKDGYIFHYARA
jgi:hypothetical protein